MTVRDSAVSCVCRSAKQPEGCSQSSTDDVNSYEKSEASCRVRQLVKELQEHYHTAKADMMLAAKTKPIHGETFDVKNIFYIE